MGEISPTAFGAQTSTPLAPTLKRGIYTAETYHRELKSSVRTCRKCLTHGHIAANRPNGIVCRQCKNTGHRRGECQMPVATTTTSSEQPTMHPPHISWPPPPPPQSRRAEPLTAVKLPARRRTNRRSNKLRSGLAPLRYFILISQWLAQAAASDGVANHPTWMLTRPDLSDTPDARLLDKRLLNND